MHQRNRHHYYLFYGERKRIRIINARKATSNEEKTYHERYKEYYR